MGRLRRLARLWVRVRVFCFSFGFISFEVADDILQQQGVLRRRQTAWWELRCSGGGVLQGQQQGHGPLVPLETTVQSEVESRLCHFGAAVIYKSKTININLKYNFRTQCPYTSNGFRKYLCSSCILVV